MPLSPTVTGGIVFACTLAGMLFGMWLRKHLPSHHKDVETHGSVKEINGLITTMTALVLGLVTASAQDSFTKVGAAVEHTAADVISLDRLLDRYGPETANIRKALRRAVEQRVERVWPVQRGAGAAPIDASPARSVEEIGSMITSLEPKTGNQQWLKAQALQLTESLLAVRWGISVGEGQRIPQAFLLIITFWLTAAFTGYAVFAPRNGTMMAILIVSAFSVACVVFLILELGDPFKGWVAVSGDPMRIALAHLGD